MSFGVASAPTDVILQGIEGVICYIDDILITGTSKEEPLERLEEVLKQLKAHGLRVKRNKCQFFQKSVTYLGHQVDANGIHTMPSKVEEIVQAPQLENQ